MNNPQNNRFSWRARIKSFQYALAGIKTAFIGQHNMWLHLTAAVLVVLMGCFFKVSSTQWLFLWACIGMVISMEIINTALEKLCDLVNPKFHPQIKQIKDLAAAAVLVAAIVSLIIGLCIFVPYIRQFLCG